MSNPKAVDNSFKAGDAVTNNVPFMDGDGEFFERVWVAEGTEGVVQECRNGMCYVKFNLPGRAPRTIFIHPSKLVKASQPCAEQSFTKEQPMDDIRLERLNKSRERDRIEEAALKDWIIPIFPVDVALFMWLGDHFRLIIDCELETWNMHPSIPADERYSFPRHIYELDPFLLRDKLVTIFGEPIPTYLGNDGLSTGVYTDADILRHSKKVGQRFWKYERINPFFLYGSVHHIKYQRYTEPVRMFDSELRWYVSTPMMNPHSAFSYPMLIEIKGRAALFGMKGYRRGNGKFIEMTPREGTAPYKHINYSGGQTLFYHPE